MPSNSSCSGTVFLLCPWGVRFGARQAKIKVSSRSTNSLRGVGGIAYLSQKNMKCFSLFSLFLEDLLLLFSPQIDFQNLSKRQTFN